MKLIFFSPGDASRVWLPGTNVFIFTRDNEYLALISCKFLSEVNFFHTFLTLKGVSRTILLQKILKLLICKF